MNSGRTSTSTIIYVGGCGVLKHVGRGRRLIDKETDLCGEVSEESGLTGSGGGQGDGVCPAEQGGGLHM